MIGGSNAEVAATAPAVNATNSRRDIADMCLAPVDSIQSSVVSHNRQSESPVLNLSIDDSD